MSLLLPCLALSKPVPEGYHAEIGLSSPLIARLGLGLNVDMGVVTSTGFGLGISGVEIAQGINLGMFGNHIPRVFINGTYVWFTRLAPFRTNEFYMGLNYGHILFLSRQVHGGGVDLWLGLNREVLPEVRGGWLINAGISLFTY